MPSCPNCDNPEIPEGAVIVNQLHIVEYIDPNDGEVYKHDLSSGPDGNDIHTGKMWELVGWAQMSNMLPDLADMVLEYIHDDEDDS